MEEKLNKIRDFADQAHGEQQRKYTPERYIVHPIRVMNLCRKVTTSLPVLASALLHDVLEDTPVSEEELYDFLFSLMGKDDAEQTLKLVIELTDVYVSSNYPRLNRRERKAKEAIRMSTISADAQTVKYADIWDNSGEIVNHDVSFAPVYLKEVLGLLQVMTKGDQSLRHEAMKAVKVGLKLLRR